MSKEHRRINQDVFEGKWKEIQGQARERWGDLTGNDLESMEGQADQLIGRLQQKYGYAHASSEEGSENSETFVLLTAKGSCPEDYHLPFRH